MEQDTTKTIRIVIDSSKAVDGSAQATRALKAIEDQTKSAADTVGRLEKAFDFVTKLTVFGFGVREVVGRLSEMWSSAREAAAAMSDLSEQLGVSTKFVQASEFAAASNTVSVDKMSKGFTKASQIIGEAAQGQKEAVDVMNNLGVKILDAGGKLRSTELILSDSAAAILKVEDPAKRVALAMSLFGKAGAELIPMLKDLALGQDVMATKAQQAGAMIEEGVLKQVAALKAHSEEASLKWNALVLNIGTPIATAAMEAVNNLLAAILANLDRLKREATASAAGVPQAKTDVQNINDQIAAQEGLLAVNPNNFSAKASLNGPSGLYARRDQLKTAQANAQQTLYQTNEDAARAGSLTWEQGYTVNPAVGVSNPGVKGAGQDLAERIQKLKDTLSAAADSQDAMTAAARRGDVAFQEQQAHTEALQKAIEAYGGKVAAADPKVQALAASLEKLIARQKEGAAAQTFVVATTELEKQNTLLTAQIALMNEAPDVQAREIALIKSKQEAEKAGNSLTAQDIENRRQAIEQNEKLKTQQEQLKQAQELWTEPLKQALRDIQTAGANAFDELLQSGNFSFQSLAQTFTTTLRKMAAEFLALATIRPVLSFAVSGLAGAGLISPAMANSVGFPQTASGSSVAGSPFGGAGVGFGGGGGGGFGNIGFPSGGGGGGWFSGLSDFMARPIGSIFPSATPAGGFSNVGDLIASGQTGASAAASGMSGLGGISIGQGLGAIGGFAGGAFTLATGGGSTGSTVAGIGQMVGAAVSLIPGFGQIAGPLIMLGSSLLGGMLGGGPKIPPMPGLNYQGGGLGFGASNPYAINTGGAYASGANAIGQSVLGLIASTGGTPVAGKLYGGWLGSGTTHTWNGQQWVGQDYTEANLSNPDGSFAGYIGGTGQGISTQAAGEALTAQIFKADVLNGAIKGVSDTLLKVFKDLNVYTVQATQDAVSFSSAYDKLGKAANPVKDTIDKLNVSFATLSQQASTYGLSLDPINAELEKETKRTAQDFIDNLLDPLAAQMRALDDSQQSALASAQYINDNIQGVYADTNKIVDYYNKQRLALEDQFYQGAITNLQNLIARLTYGDLANASPGTMLSGTSASYTAALAQAQAGDATAITNLPGLAETYATTARSYFASGPQYAALVDQIRQDLGNVVAVASGGATPAGSTADPQQINAAVQVQMAANDQLREVVQTQSDQIESLKNMVSALAAQLRNIAVNM